MDVTTKTYDQVVREFEVAEMELDMKIREVLDKIQKKAIEKIEYKLSLEYIEWKKQNAECLVRNKSLIKDLEFIKAKLRSRYYYQPATNTFDIHLKKLKTHAKNKSEKNILHD